MLLSLKLGGNSLKYSKDTQDIPCNFAHITWTHLFGYGLSWAPPVLEGGVASLACVWISQSIDPFQDGKTLGGS